MLHQCIWNKNKQATSGTDKILQKMTIQLGIETQFDLNLHSNLVKHNFFQSKKESRSVCRYCFLQRPAGGQSSSACGASCP